MKYNKKPSNTAAAHEEVRTFNICNNKKINHIQQRSETMKGATNL